MPRYQITWTEEQWYTETVEADNEEQARQMVFDGSFVWPEPYAWEIQDSIDVEELNG